LFLITYRILGLCAQENTVGLKSPNNRAASRTVFRWSSIGGHYVCVEELDIVKMKNLHDL